MHDGSTTAAAGSTNGFIIAPAILGPASIRHSAPRAPHHPPDQLSAKSERRIARLRQLLIRHHQPRLRFTSVGARAIQKEWCRRYPEPAPSLSAIQRVLKRHQLTTQPPKPCRQVYRPHPLATYPDAVHATDIITPWITGGEVVQTFNTVDVYSNDVYSSLHATKMSKAACGHLLQTWQQLGVPTWPSLIMKAPSAAAIIRVGLNACNVHDVLTTDT